MYNLYSMLEWIIGTKYYNHYLFKSIFGSCYPLKIQNQNSPLWFSILSSNFSSLHSRYRAHVQYFIQKEYRDPYVILRICSNNFFKGIKDNPNQIHCQSVYQTPCSYGNSYIRQINRSIQSHLKEYISYTLLNYLNK